MIKDRNIFYKYSIYSWFMSYIEEEKNISTFRNIRKEPNPNQFEKIKVKFNNNEEKPGENIEEIQVNRPNVTNIVKDKRKTNLVDREAILLKIMNQRNVIDETDKKDRTVQDNMDYLKIKDSDEEKEIEEKEEMVEKAVKVNDLDMEKITTLKPVRKLVIKRNIDVEKQIETNKNEEEEKKR